MYVALLKAWFKVIMYVACIAVTLRAYTQED
jgi:hypothetical protein